MARIVIIPGLSVRAYAEPPARALVRHGHRVSLLAAPGWRQGRADLADYGRLLAHDLESRDETVDLLVGLSVGTQAAAVAAANTGRIKRLLLISPTIDPVHRTFPRLMWRWLRGDSDGPKEQSGLQLHLGDWMKSGPTRIGIALRSALRIPLEEILPTVSAAVTVVHAEHDVLATEAWSRSLAVDDAHFRQLADGPHSWPADNGEEFAALVSELLAQD